MSASARRLYDVAEKVTGGPSVREAIENIAADLDSKQAGLRYEAGVHGTTLTTLKVPKEHIVMFRFGLLRELQFDGGWIRSQAKEAREHMRRYVYADWFPERERRDAPCDPLSFLAGPLRETLHDADHLRLLGVEEPSSDVTLTGEAHALKHSLEAVAKHCANELSDTELGGDEMLRVGATVAWATAEAVRIEAEVIEPDIARRKAERGEEAA